MAAYEAEANRARSGAGCAFDKSKGELFVQKDELSGVLGSLAVLGLGLAIAGCARSTIQNPPLAGVQLAPAAQRQWIDPKADRPGKILATTRLLHLRAGPGVNGMVIGTLPPGTPVQATGSQQGGWWEVQTPDGTGWVSSAFLSAT